jgi:NADH:ubiquinone oxidoreductase subunit F (NADH-binding)
MKTEPRVLDAVPVATIDEYRSRGGLAALHAARSVDPNAVIETLEASGLRGRGGAGFPTGAKWRTVAAYRSPSVPTTVVVNAAEGEPGSFKDRAIVRTNPYRVLEGAMIGAWAVGADRVIVAVKASFERELTLLRSAVAELLGDGVVGDLELEVVVGPDEYLYGEETALLEVLDGRSPFPRVAPPFRHGVDEIGTGAESAAGLELAGTQADTVAPPTLVNNVETFANVPGIVQFGPDWFRRVGTARSPGTIVCTVTGRTQRHGVAEVAMGTPLGAVIDQIGAGALGGRRLVAAMSGVANPLVPAARFDTPLTYEDMEALGSGLGACGFIVFDDSTDMAAVAHGVSRFLAVESCGQCTPCKRDGLALSERLDQLRRSDAAEAVLDEIGELAAIVSNEARCFLAHQHKRVLESILALFPDQLRAHLVDAPEPIPSAGTEVIAAIVDFDGDRAVLDQRHPFKQPDWTYDADWSGASPADVIDERRRAS